MKRKHQPILRLTSCVLALALSVGCATKSRLISPSYVSQNQYSGMSVNEIQQELFRVESKLAAACKAQDSDASSDVFLTFAGILLLWPLLLFVPGGDNEAEVAHLKGQRDALQQALTAATAQQGSRRAVAVAVDQQRTGPPSAGDPADLASLLGEEPEEMLLGISEIKGAYLLVPVPDNVTMTAGSTFDIVRFGKRIGSATVARQKGQNVALELSSGTEARVGDQIRYVAP